jgi:hypothetical protein
MMGGMKKESRDRRVRRIATRRGYTASLSKVRDRAAPGFGRWTITGPKGGPVSPPGGWTLDQVEGWIERMWERS